MSFEVPEYTANAYALGALNFRGYKFITEKKTKFYQVGTSEMYGAVQSISLNENRILSIKSLWCCKIICPLDYKNYRKHIKFSLVMVFY